MAVVAHETNHKDVLIFFVFSSSKVLSTTDDLCLASSAAQKDTVVRVMEAACSRPQICCRPQLCCKPPDEQLTPLNYQQRQAFCSVEMTHHVGLARVTARGSREQPLQVLAVVTHIACTHTVRTKSPGRPPEHYVTAAAAAHPACSISSGWSCPAAPAQKKTVWPL